VKAAPKQISNSWIWKFKLDHQKETRTSRTKEQDRHGFTVEMAEQYFAKIEAAEKGPNTKLVSTKKEVGL
jgi:hypothetical protein